MKQNNTKFELTQVNSFPPIGGNIALEGTSVPINYLPPSIQNYINNFTEGLVLVRERNSATRCKGTLWYRGEILGFTVEDVVRAYGVKKSGTTAIPDNISDPELFRKQSLGTGAYYLNFRQTGVKSLTRNYIDFPNDESSTYKTGVFPHLGGTPGGSVRRDQVYFSGVRIHSGKDETYSSGCIIFGRVQDDNYRLTLTTNSIGPVTSYPGSKYGDIEGCQLLSQFIYNTFGFAQGKRNCKMMIINAFDFPIYTPPETKGKIVDSNSKLPINNNIRLQIIEERNNKTNVETKNKGFSPTSNPTAPSIDIDL
jgi:hypothetical protein